MAINVNFGGPILASSTYINGTAVQRDVKFTLPEAAVQTAEINAMGTHEVPMKGRFDAMEHTCAFDRFDSVVAQAYEPNASTIEHRWVQEEIGPDGAEHEVGYKAFIRGVSKSAYPSGDVEAGNTPGYELKRSVSSIFMYREGKEILAIDRFNQTYRINGKDCYRSIEQYL